MAPCARAVREQMGSAATSTAAAMNVLRSIMAASWGCDPIGAYRRGAPAALKKPLRPLRAPGQREQRHVVVVPLADLLRAGILEYIFRRFSLTNDEVHDEQ